MTGLNPAMEQMLLQWMAKRTGTPIEDLRDASRSGPAALAKRLGIEVPAEMLDVTAVESDEPAPAPARPRAPAVERRMHALEGRLQEIEEAYRATAAMLVRVSATLGACSCCFGFDPDCSECSGEGSPGYVASRCPRMLRRWLRDLGVQRPQTTTTPTTNE